jgi:hypothetical protein
VYGVLVIDEQGGGDNVEQYHGGGDDVMPENVDILNLEIK